MNKMARFGLLCMAVMGFISSPAIAQTSFCETGLINNEEINGDVIITGTECYISESVIRGNITVTDSPLFGMTFSAVYGRVEINNLTSEGDVIIKDTFVFDRSLVVDGAGEVWIFDSQVVGKPDTSNTAFRNITDEVQLINNIFQGNLTCTEGIPFVLEERNFVGGKDTCATGD
jgi:hypothetical protein